MEYKIDEINPESYIKYLLSLEIKKTGIYEMEVELIKLTKCNSEQAKFMTQQLKDLGLDYHYPEEEGSDHDFDWYDIASFAKMRGWFWLGELEVSQDFINENKKLAQTRPKSRKSGPYTKHERQKRRNEVYRLHFEYGYSARKIADLMKINRHTIDSDIQYLYSTLQHDDNKITIDDLINKQRLRFEYQRNRLMERLEKTDSFQEKLQFERLIFDIDSKLTNTYHKINDSKLDHWNEAVDYINKWMKDNRKDDRYLLYGSLITTSENKRNRIHKILKEKQKWQDIHILYFT